MLTGVSIKERWILWAILFWIIMTGGPGLLLASTPEFIGPLPVLYVYCFVGWIAGIIINAILVYKISFVNVDELEMSLIDEAKSQKGGK